jgi:hypothetical protein
MEDSDVAIYGGLVVLGLVLAFLLCWCSVGIIRRIFRINEIVDLLKQIATGEKGVVFRRQSDLKRCAVCEKEYPSGKLIKIASGQLFCPECHKVFVKKLKAGEYCRG